VEGRAGQHPHGLLGKTWLVLLVQKRLMGVHPILGFSLQQAAFASVNPYAMGLSM
jgi:hypothetical protein